MNTLNINQNISSGLVLHNIIANFFLLNCCTCEAEEKRNLKLTVFFSGLYRDVQSICLSVTWRAEDKKQQVLDGKVCAPSDVEC